MPAMTRHLDATGLKCPLPVLRARKVLIDLAMGETLEVIADDPMAPMDFEHFCNQTGHELVERDVQDDHVRIVIRRAV